MAEYPVTSFPWWKRLLMSAGALNRAAEEDYATVQRGWVAGRAKFQSAALPPRNPYRAYDQRGIRQRQFDEGFQAGYAGDPPFTPPDRLITKGG